ncbi:ribosomal protein S18-alanine N-acetyltransferase [Streptococcus pantholopis]|uniref:[Ribosomal protein bS18]-alanine N-acetyltransferase n=1 Tax=Streptococcus pantholopis TaxID=1811193 RepID=A0A172Q986_9STRE|nr:ribosomal protein S18-alanine N-acetyltransferase [Streptococcus pantholopis]AND80049.1 ribosomal-protein-alanine N-acetyltransferase RimI [Streptococcus pantholopis]
MKMIKEKAAAVLAVLEDVYGSSPWSEQQIAKDMEQDHVDYFFVQAQEKIAGFLSVQHLVGELEITNIAVMRQYQGQGLGSQLLSHLDKLDFPIFLEVRESNRAAQALYRKFGFEIVGKRQNYYQEPLEPAIVMKREGGYER